MIDLDYSNLSEQELYDLLTEANKEQNRRFEASIAVEQAQRSIRAFREVNEREQGAEWVVPLQATDAYMLGDTVTVDGVLWRSERDFNYAEAGTDGWVVESGAA